MRASSKFATCVLLMALSALCGVWGESCEAANRQALGGTGQLCGDCLAGHVEAWLDGLPLFHCYNPTVPLCPPFFYLDPLSRRCLPCARLNSGALCDVCDAELAQCSVCGRSVDDVNTYFSVEDQRCQEPPSGTRRHLFTSGIEWKPGDWQITLQQLEESPVPTHPLLLDAHRSPFRADSWLTRAQRLAYDLCGPTVYATQRLESSHIVCNQLKCSPTQSKVRDDPMATCHQNV